MSEPCVKAELIDRIQADIVTINKRLDKHSEKIDKDIDTKIVIERTVTILDEMRSDAKEQKEFNQKITDTLQSIQTTMIETTCNMRELAKNQEETNKKISTMSNEYDERFDDVTSKIEKVDNKSKIDVTENTRDAAKQKIAYFVAGGGSIAGVIYIVSEVIKALAK